MHQQSSTEINSIIDLKNITYATQQIVINAEYIRNAYEHLIRRYETISKEYLELKSHGANISVDSANISVPTNHEHKRRKTDDSVVDYSLTGNDLLNEAIQEISSCVEDEFIEATPKAPKADVSRRNVSKKITVFKSPNKHIKMEKFDDSKDDSLLAPRTEIDKRLESPLKSVENQSNVGKENRNKTTAKWISNTLKSPSRVSRSGFISPKLTRLSLARPSKQATSEFAKKPAKETEMNTCGETFFDGSPPKQISNVKGKFLRQQCLEACISSSKDSDDENVFSFKSNAKSNAASSKSPPNIKLEPQTEQAKNSQVTSESHQTQTGSSGSSVVVLSGVKNEVIVIEESQPLFDDCSETFCDKIELKAEAVESLASKRELKEHETIVANHSGSCRQCRMFMESNPRLTIAQKLDMIDRCKVSLTPDTDPEYWNPRFLPTPESQKQETLIDDRWKARKRKS